MLRVALVYVGEPESPTHPVMSPPVGVQVLGTVLRQAGYVADVFDSRLQSADRLREKIDDFAPDVVGLSFLSPNAAKAIALGHESRARQRFVVAGGVHASVHADTLIESGAFDTVVRKDGENAILEVCAALAHDQRPARIIAGTSVANLDQLPIYDRFDCYDAVYAGLREGDFVPAYLQLSRGCPMKCTFCELPNSDVFNPPRARTFKSVDRAMAEAHTYVDRWGVNFITLVDSIATLRTPLIVEFVRRMNDELPDVGFMLNSQVNVFREELAVAIGEAQRGRPERTRITVWFGFESGSQRLLDFMRKGTTVVRGLEVASWCRQHDVQIGANILLGVPTETQDDYDGHDGFLAEIKPTFPNPNILNPLPGTELHRLCVERDLLVDRDDLSIWSAEKIRELGRGPVRGVDYGRVLDAYHRYRNLPAHAGHRYESWAGDDQ